MMNKKYKHMEDKEYSYKCHGKLNFNDKLFMGSRDTIEKAIEKELQRLKQKRNYNGGVNK